MTRIYHITLLILSPLFIVGGMFVIERLIRIINIKNKLKQNHVILILILGVLIPYFLFNTGFVYEMTKDSPTTMSLDMERMKNDNFTKSSFYNTFTPEQDVYSAIWYYKYKNVNKMIYADGDSQMHVLYSYGMTSLSAVKSLYSPNNLNKDRLIPNYYLYMNKFDLCHDNPKVNKSVIFSLFNNSSKIYSNGCGEIYEK